MNEENKNQKLIKEMLNKSQESFLLGIEIYNKPTISYRLEGCAFFLTNAWELLLKAKLLAENKSIYYKDKPKRTLSLNNCIRLIFTNDKDPIRKNLEIIVGLRNTSTHFIVKEMEQIYLPFLQAAVLNYSQKLFDYFNIDITSKINSSFMALVMNTEEIKDEQILSKYGENVFERYIETKKEAKAIINNIQSDKLAIKIDLNVKIVKDNSKAQTTFRLAKEGEEPIVIMKELKDTNLSHRFNQKRVRELVEENLKRKGISFKLNQYSLQLIVNKFNLKSNEEYFYHYNLTNTWSCSQKLIDFLTNLISNNTNIVNEIKIELKKEK